ncbi:PAS domain S-box-containing protein [Desulfocicer vacuolatum DSM 3385]|uniref:histidine kinase n=1 Tax=Desulfocicer vacuolatum DSM 3385 TaxID=1121400 RepID=A0A1W2AZA0_9BACT|nr:PAS domain S-box-containing protein [Desulfocicer vacuolatum DSM 3385]
MAGFHSHVCYKKLCVGIHIHHGKGGIITDQWFQRLKKIFISLKIRYKFLISFSTIFFLFMLLCCLVVYFFLKKNIEENIESELNNTTQMIHSMVKTSATVSIKNYLRAVAEKNKEIIANIYRQTLENTLSTSQAKKKAAKILLSQTIGTSGYIYCVDSTGTVLTHPRTALLGANVAHHAFVTRQMTSPRGYLEYDWKNPGETNSRPKALYMVYFEPWDWIISVTAYRTEFNKLINVDDFQKSILSLKFGETGYSFVIDNLGNAIIHPKLQDINILNTKELSNECFEYMKEKKKGKLIYYWKNLDESVARQKLVIFNYIPEYQWFVASSCYLKEFYRPLETLRNCIFGIFFAFLMLMLPIIFKICASITTPLYELMERFESVRGGDFSVRMVTESTDEIGQLTSYFNRSMEQLETYHDNLQNQIKERRMAQEAQKESQQRYFLLMEAAPDPIITYNKEGDVLYINPVFTKVFGWPLEECIGLRMDHFVPEDNWSETQMMINEIIAGRAINNIETRRYAKDGQTVYVSISGAPTRDRNGDLSGSIIIHRDITKSKQLEKQLLHAGDRERQKIGQDLHDDLCPHLIGVAGLATVVKNDLAQQSHGSAALAEKIVMLMEDAISKTQTMARGLCPVHLVAHGLQNALEQIVNTFKYTPGIKIGFKTSETVICEDNNVATHLYHIAREAVNNAVKHSGGNCIEISLFKKNGFVHLWIEDNGKWIKTTGPTKGIGLQIMAYRAKIIDGGFEIKTTPGGSKIKVCIKYKYSV